MVLGFRFVLMAIAMMIIMMATITVQKEYIDYPDDDGNDFVLEQRPTTKEAVRYDNRSGRPNAVDPESSNRKEEKTAPPAADPFRPFSLPGVVTFPPTIAITKHNKTMKTKATTKIPKKTTKTAAETEDAAGNNETVVVHSPARTGLVISAVIISLAMIVVIMAAFYCLYIDRTDESLEDRADGGRKARLVMEQQQQQQPGTATNQQQKQPKTTTNRQQQQTKQQRQGKSVSGNRGSIKKSKKAGGQPQQQKQQRQKSLVESTKEPNAESEMTVAVGKTVAAGKGPQSSSNKRKYQAGGGSLSNKKQRESNLNKMKTSLMKKREASSTTSSTIANQSMTGGNKTQESKRKNNMAHRSLVSGSKKLPLATENKQSGGSRKSGSGSARKSDIGSPATGTATTTNRASARDRSPVPAASLATKRPSLSSGKKKRRPSMDGETGTGVRFDSSTAAVTAAMLGAGCRRSQSQKRRGNTASAGPGMVPSTVISSSAAQMSQLPTTSDVFSASSMSRKSIPED